MAQPVARLALVTFSLQYLEKRLRLKYTTAAKLKFYLAGGLVFKLVILAEEVGAE